MSQNAVETAPPTLVHYEVREGVAYLTLDDPPANTYTHEMMRQLDEGILKARFDPAVHVVVVTGTGEKMFCAGANINMLKTSDPNFKYYFCLHANETLSRLEQTPKLVIAALNGNTVGGGLEIAMAWTTPSPPRPSSPASWAAWPATCRPRAPRSRRATCKRSARWPSGAP